MSRHMLPSAYTKVSLKEKGVVKSREGDGSLRSAVELNCYIMEVLLPPQNKK